MLCHIVDTPVSDVVSHLGSEAHDRESLGAELQSKHLKPSGGDQAHLGRNWGIGHPVHVASILLASRRHSRNGNMRLTLEGRHGQVASHAPGLSELGADACGAGKSWQILLDTIHIHVGQVKGP